MTTNLGITGSAHWNNIKMMELKRLSFNSSFHIFLLQSNWNDSNYLLHELEFILLDSVFRRILSISNIFMRMIFDEQK